ncbi:MAG TPA: hypothetical protein VMG12_34305 [Polyangiaceae bacterium]|nr:hypothetical protein [Polyangiaceae bacterium]
MVSNALSRSLAAFIAFIALVFAALPGAARAEPPAPIDRRALLARHSPTLTQIDPESPLMVGNGSLAMTADITGLSTFGAEYSSLAPLTLRAQWAWHEFPNPKRYGLEQSLVPLDVRGKKQRFPWLRSAAETKSPAIAWLRENPHRFALGRLSLSLARASGAPAAFSDLTDTRQTLDLWTGRLTSHFVLEGVSVDVETSVHPALDLVIVSLRSPLLRAGRLGMGLEFPGVSTRINPDPADFEHPESHQTRVVERDARGIGFERRIDATRYFARLTADRDVALSSTGPHAWRVTTAADELCVLVLFTPDPAPAALPSAEQAREDVARFWQRYWSEGAVVDFSGSSDPRAAELERRVVLSQYLMALNAAGRVPPQEEGLFSNSWNGKFHLEMHPWHAAHFATWGRPELLERSMPWYLGHLPQARVRARELGARGAWWPKMVGPEGRESPSVINPFIMWQQPHPIFLAELAYRSHPDRATLERYRELVFDTAELLASYPHFDAKRDRYVLGPPIIPAQEVFPPLSTWNPAFELEYFRFGLGVAQLWRERLGLARDADWQRVIDKLSALPQKDGLYLATESQPGLWDAARSPECRRRALGPSCLNRDHPSMLAALGLLPGAGVDRESMRRTLRAVASDWDLRQTWGWDFPMLAMTAARLGEPSAAVDWLLYDAPNFRFGRAGMTPRSHLDAERSAGSAQPEAYRRDAETYFPSNGALLLAVGMMAGGWDGESKPHPGFPDDGRWVVRSEGLSKLP